MDTYLVSSIVLRALCDRDPNYDVYSNLGKFRELPENFLSEMLADLLDPATVATLSGTCRLMRSSLFSPLPASRYFVFEDKDSEAGDYVGEVVKVYKDLGVFEGRITNIIVKLENFFDQG
jgi:hypothetical protein